VRPRSPKPRSVPGASSCAAPRLIGDQGEL
jgi:hypothetical protein